MKKETFNKGAKEYFVITLGCVIYAIAFDWFYLPNNLTCGGLTGVAQIIHHFVPILPIGGMLIAMNVPLYLLGFKRYGFRFLVKSLYAMALSSVLVDALASLYTFQAMEELLACVYGGVLLGVGCGLINSMESNTGGTELLSWLLKRQLPQLSLGNVMLGLDLIVIIGYAAPVCYIEDARSLRLRRQQRQASAHHLHEGERDIGRAARRGRWRDEVTRDRRVHEHGAPNPAVRGAPPRDRDGQAHCQGARP